MLPTASPSGREWEQTRKRSPRRDDLENGGEGIVRYPAGRGGRGRRVVMRIAGRAGVLCAEIGIHRAHTHYSAAFLWRLRERSISSSMRAWKRPERSARKASSGTWRTPMRSLSSKRM